MCAASSACVQSLYNLTLNKLCCSMDEDILLHVYEWYPAPMILEVIWKVRSIIKLERNYAFLNINNFIL